MNEKIRATPLALKSYVAVEVMKLEIELAATQRRMVSYRIAVFALGVSVFALVLSTLNLWLHLKNQG